MKREIITTGDGSTTIHLPEWNEQYHSKHGAIQEAQHVFIEMGLRKLLERDPAQISILEIGFGTGLNALVTWRFLKEHSIQVTYTGVEAYPIKSEEAVKLNFAEALKEHGAADVYNKLHTASWGEAATITPFFTLIKQQKFFDQISDVEKYDLVYFDAFGARVQPDLWTAEIFKLMIVALKPGGILVTYAAKGSVRRAMQEVGFLVEKLPGPPGKREMLRAVKPQE
ncbi:tRNA (5-methylaminomethyl-2-thiouridine)(34)-methyltransferase MnmD [Antarcticibacterium flavum]|uniref:tRNA (5-methylaminomethyl-2-thiouridine)(34)-methyltransferase MnmD n=1 Tax=Antarcticibacterium flavum TaxID=2058175 RepID=A0A5B7X0B8_9FLAO|nr:MULTISPECIES: tRNA (5-methylaminomethyl-2-thiouridine)(34)-methyltransferase MnmD [Antarcticibacterium]MCM4160746.1 SAM-dependent methyltransferase [Antarcticibacterium sp. W02-3]QCY68777.1 tRNA (5-methylaminomethyl-2-thiouridine)(34)-methyltransferase MnmD [Antarcticibacterium flavum]